MNYWILSLPREDMEHCIKIGTFGANKKFLLGQVCTGDKIVCYVTREYKIIALGQATSDYYLDDAQVFKREGVFPDRFNFEAKALSKELDFMDIRDRVSFVKSRTYWALFSKAAIYRMSKQDWELISLNS